MNEARVEENRKEGDFNPMTTDEILLRAGTTGERQVWFTRPEAKKAVNLARVEDGYSVSPGADRVLRSSVPEHWKGCTSPIGAVQSYIAELEQELIKRGVDVDMIGQPEPEPPFGSKRAAAFALYKGPFHYKHGYVYDSNSQIVSDDGGAEESVKTHIAARVRGWGRIGYMPDGAVLQDAVGHIIAEALTELWKKEAVK